MVEEDSLAIKIAHARLSNHDWGGGRLLQLVYLFIYLLLSLVL